MKHPVLFLSALLLFSCSSNDEGDTPPDADIDLGTISEEIYETSGSFVFSNETTTQKYIFEVNAYSRLELSINGHDGSLALFSDTPESALTHNGGVLGGGSPYIEYFSTGSLTRELHEGNYTIVIENSAFSEDNDGTYAITITNINELRPYENLGVLDLPYNQVHTPTPDRAATIYDFEISEPTTARVFTNGLIYSDTRVHLKLMNELGEELYSFPGPSTFLLEKGNYQLRFSWNAGFAFILGDAEAGDQDVGVLPTGTPYTMNIDIDLTYEPDDAQRIYFETTQNTRISGLEFNLDPFLTFLYKSDGTSISSYDNLPAGKYYFEFVPDSFAYFVNSDMNHSVYQVLTGSYELIFTAI